MQRHPAMWPSWKPCLQAAARTQLRTTAQTQPRMADKQGFHDLRVAGIGFVAQCWRPLLRLCLLTVALIEPSIAAHSVRRLFLAARRS
jgi:hypothetical protein